MVRTDRFYVALFALLVVALLSGWILGQDALLTWIAWALAALLAIAGRVIGSRERRDDT